MFSQWFSSHFPIIPAIRNKFSTFFTKQITIEAICCILFYAIFNPVVLMKPNKTKAAIFTKQITIEAICFWKENAIFDFFMSQLPEKWQQISFNSRLTDDRSTIPKPLQSNLRSGETFLVLCFEKLKITLISGGNWILLATLSLFSMIGYGPTYLGVSFLFTPNRCTFFIGDTFRYT